MFQSTIGFGLVSIPVRVYKAMETERIPLHWVHRSCQSRIQYQKYCPTCRQGVDASELAKAAASHGRLVILETPVNPPIDPEDAKTIAIHGFHRLEEIDPIFYRAAYWLEPSTGSAKAYHLLLNALDQSALVATARLMMRDTPNLAMVRPMAHRVLVLQTLFYPESLRAEGLDLAGAQAQSDERELALAHQLIQQMTSTFDPKAYPNQPRRELMQRIEALAQQQVPGLPTGAIPADLMDLMSQLKASVDAHV